jgi:hypothetical protein
MSSPGGNGSNGDGFDEFEELIRDREEFDFDENPRADYDPYADFASAGSGGAGPRSGGAGAFGDRGLVDAITRIIESLGGIAGDALSPETRRRLEKALRDLLVVLRDIITAMIERIDNRGTGSFEMEEIPID